MTKEKEPKEPTVEELNEYHEFQRACWIEIKSAIHAIRSGCQKKKDCEHCKSLKEDVEVLDGLIMFMTEPEPMETGTTA